MIEVAALIVALAVFTLCNAFAMWWFARSLTALSAGVFNLKQVAAADGSVTEAEAAAAPAEPAATDRLNIRTNLSRLSDEDLAAAVRDPKGDVRVITMDENSGISEDVEPIPKGGRGVYAR